MTTWLERLGIGLPCLSCGYRGMRRVGSRLYRCERPECPGRGDTRMLVLWGGHVCTLNMATALVLDEHRRVGLVASRVRPRIHPSHIKTLLSGGDGEKESKE